MKTCDSEREQSKEILLRTELRKMETTLESLLDQQDPNSDYAQKLAAELFFIKSLQELPQEELFRDPWVMDNLKIESG